MSITESRTDAQSGDHAEVWQARLPDLRGISLSELRGSANPVLLDNIERLTDEVGDPGAASAGFQSAL